jgi:hypothetical protein
MTNISGVLSETTLAIKQSVNSVIASWLPVNSMLIALLVGIGTGIGLAAALLTYRQCRTDHAETDAQRQDALERFKIWNNFWKYFLVSFALVLITTLLGNTLKERELALKTAEQTSAFQTAEYTNLGRFIDRALVDDVDKQIQFASYFSLLTGNSDERVAMVGRFASEMYGNFDGLPPGFKKRFKANITDVAFTESQDRSESAGNNNSSIETPQTEPTDSAAPVKQNTQPATLQPGAAQSTASET